MCDVTGARHAIAVSSGTAALHLILRSLDIKEGDEIITTPYSFVASSNAALFQQAIPVFVDIEEDTFNIDPSLVEQSITNRTKAILAVDVFGLPANWNGLRQIAEKHGLALIDDSCEALGATYEGTPVGSLADASAFGFYPNKQITTGEGGCITTDSERVAELCRSMLNQGRATREKMEHVRLGFNYRLSEIAAALGCVQLERLDELLEKRTKLAEFYSHELDKYAESLILPQHTPGRSWFVYVICLQNHLSRFERDSLLGFLDENGIGCAPYFPAIHLQPFYVEEFGFRRGSFPVAEQIADRTLAIPFFPDMSRDDAKTVTSIIEAGLKRIKSKGKPIFPSTIARP